MATTNRHVRRARVTIKRPDAEPEVVVRRRFALSDGNAVLLDRQGHTTHSLDGAVVTYEKGKRVTVVSGDVSWEVESGGCGCGGKRNQ